MVRLSATDLAKRKDDLTKLIKIETKDTFEEIKGLSLKKSKGVHPSDLRIVSKNKILSLQDKPRQTNLQKKKFELRGNWHILIILRDNSI